MQLLFDFRKTYWAGMRQALSVLLPGLFMLVISLIGLKLSSDVQGNQSSLRERQQQLLNMVDSSRGAQLFYKNQQEAWRNLQDTVDNGIKFSHHLREYRTAENLVKRQLDILLKALTSAQLDTDLTQKVIAQHYRFSEMNDASLSTYYTTNISHWRSIARESRGLEQQLSNRFGTLIGSVVLEATAQIQIQNEESTASWKETQQLLFWITAVGVMFTSWIAWLNQRANKRVSQALNTLKHAKNELVRSEKLAALGALVAGVSHELNTPLGNSVTISTSIGNWVRDIDRLAADGTLKRSDLIKFCDQAKQGCELLDSSLIRASEIVRSFKQVAVDQTSDRHREFSLSSLADETIRTLCHQFKGTPYKLSCDIPEHIRITGKPGAFVQVLNNLILNGLKHGLADHDEGEVRVTAEQFDANWIQIRVTDTGSGVPKSIAPKIFDPFFSTKMGQGGSGLGLYIVHNIATGVLGGRLRLDTSTTDSGATFILDIPSQGQPSEETVYTNSHSVAYS